MTNTKEKNRRFYIRGPAPSDHKIYKSGYMMLRPVQGKAKHHPSDPEDVTKESESSINND